MEESHLPGPRPPQVTSAIAMEVPEGGLLVANACGGHSHIGLQGVMKVPGDLPWDVPHTLGSLGLSPCRTFSDVQLASYGELDTFVTTGRQPRKCWTTGFTS